MRSNVQNDSGLRGAIRQILMAVSFAGARGPGGDLSLPATGRLPLKYEATGSLTLVSGRERRNRPGGEPSDDLSHVC